MNRLGTYRKEAGDATAALESYRRAHQIFAVLLTADPKNSLAKSNFAFSDDGIAESLVVLGKRAEAIKTYREAIATFEEMSPRTGSDRYPRTGLADSYSGLGQIYASLAKGRNISPNLKRQYWEESRSSCQKSLALWNDKEKRGELASGEKESSAVVGKCIAESEGAVSKLGSGAH